MANLLTSIRVLLALPMGWMLSSPFSFPAWLSVSVVAMAIASDYFDGIVARATNTASARGMLFDHGADCLFVSSACVGLGLAGYIPLILPLLIVAAFAQYVFDSYVVYRQKGLRMSALGRLNGIAYFVPAILVSVATIDSLETVRDSLLLTCRFLAYVLIFSTLLSIIDRATAPWRRQSTG